MKKIVLLIMLAAVGMFLQGEECSIISFRNFNPKAWSSFRGGKIVPSEKGAIVSVPGMVTGSVSIPRNRRKDWAEKYNGIAFRIKGNGSAEYGCIALLLQANAFQFYFPLKSTQWVEYKVHFKDFTVYNGSGLTLEYGVPGNISIEGLDRVRFGDRWTITHNNAARKKVSYEVDGVRLVSDAKVLLETGKYKAPSFENVKKKMRSGKKVTILCLGDSITAGSALREPNKTRYAAQAQDLLRKEFKNPQLRCYSMAVGGAISFDVNCWVYRDFESIPDVVTLMVGFNDKSNGVHKEGYRGILNQWIDRVLAKTKGKSAIVLITPIPGAGPRYLSQDDYAQVVREVAAKRSLPCLDMNKVFKAIPRKDFTSYLADSAHPNVKGQAVFAKAFAAFFAK